MRLLFLTGSRGEWGYIRPLLRLCGAEGLEYRICATNMHVLPAFGLSVNEIRADGFEVSDEIFMSLEGHNHFTLSKSLGIFLSSFSDLLGRVKPDWLILAGDRGEQLMGSIAGAHTYTPVAHIQAGELSGNIDGIARHAIGKFAHLHFAANEDAAERLRRLGEEPFRIHNVGAPQLDELTDGVYSSPGELGKRYGIDVSRPYLLVLQHSVTEEYAAAPRQIEATLQAVNAFDMMKIWVMPNNDPGCDYVREALIRGREGESHMFDNLKRQDYLGLLKGAAAIVGNSSSGLIEAPSFGVPCVNVGRRQANRLRGLNVIDCGHDAAEIRASIAKACSAEFKASLREMKNPYGDGRSSSRILQVLRTTPVDSRLLTKQLTY